MARREKEWCVEMMNGGGLSDEGIGIEPKKTSVTVRVFLCVYDSMSDNIVSICMSQIDSQCGMCRC